MCIIVPEVSLSIRCLNIFMLSRISLNYYYYIHRYQDFKQKSSKSPKMYKRKQN